jgi:hypothetical protein
MLSHFSITRKVSAPHFAWMGGVGVEVLEDLLAPALLGGNHGDDMDHGSFSLKLGTSPFSSFSRKNGTPR